MRLRSRARSWDAYLWSVLTAGAFALGASGCIGDDGLADEEPEQEESTAALLDEDECMPSDVTFTPASSETQACAGPWTYSSYDVETSRHSLCGAQACTLYKSCTRWLLQTPSTPTLDITLAPLECHLVVGEGLVCTPNWAGAQAACESFRIQKRNEIEAPADQRVTSATVSAEIVTPYPYTAQPNAFKCRATINWEKSSTGRHVDCGCETMEYPLCAHRIGTPKLRITATGKTKAWVKQAHDQTPAGQYNDDEIGAACTSAEDVPATNLALKLDRILNSLADPAIVPAGNSARIAEYVRRAKVTYELFSNSDVASPLARHADALNLYLGGPGYWNIEPTCGLHKPVTQQCPGVDERLLRFCTRLTSAHVKVVPGYGDLLWRYYEPSCNELLYEIRQEIQAGDCSLDDDFTIATIDTHRRLQEKLLLSMGYGLDRSASGNNTAAIARTLNAIDDWYAGAAYMFMGTDRAREELDLVANKFWQVAYGHQPVAEEQGWLEQSPYAELQAALDEAEAEPEDAVGILQGALEDTDTRGLKLDRDVLTAAYATVGSEPALQGVPLLHFTAGALDALVDRLEALGQFHDVGCSLADCAAFSTPTKLSRFWKILAHLGTAPGSEPDLGDVLAGTPGTLVGWKAAFLAVDGAQQRLLDALAAASDADSPNEMSSLIAQARARDASYEATGMFLPAVGNRMYTGVHAGQRTRVKDHLNFLNSTLATSRTSIENRLMQMVDGLVRVRDGETAFAQLEAAKTRLKSETDDLSKRDAAFRKLIATGGENPAFEELMAGWSQVVDAIDEEAYLRVGDSTDLTLDGQNATFVSWAGKTLADVGVSKVEVPARRAVSIATEVGSQWAPSCALRDVRMIDPESDGEGQGIDQTVVPTGPEGYSVTWTGSRFEATSEHSSVTGRVTAGARVEGCAGSPGFAVVGGGVRVCSYVEASVTGEHGRNWQSGTQGSTSAQFSSGIFLPTTPFEAPVGALVVVEMPPGATDPSAIRNVHLVHGPHTTLVVDEAADLWFAVNDIYCENQDGSKDLSVKVTTYLSVGDAAEALVNRMAHTLSLVRERRAGLLARGEILPSEATEIELQAKLDQIGGPGELQIAVDDYPAPMRDLFYKYLAREMKLLEAEIRAASIGRELAIKKAEHVAAQVAVKNSAMSGYLLSLQPKWSARGLDFKELRSITSVYVKDVRYYMGPLLRVWYPEVLEDLAGSPALQQLTNVDIDTPILVISDLLNTLGNQVAVKIASAEVPYPSPEDTAPSFVALRFPHPSVLDPACADSPSARCPRQGHGSTFRWATVAQSEALWSAIGQPGDEQTSRRLIFQPSPDDLYQLLAGTHYLSCTKSLPVVRKVGLALTGFTSTQLPPEQREIEGNIPDAAPMVFADGAGVREFQLENPSWHHLANVPLIYGTNDYNDVRGDFAAHAQDVRGVSPFTTFVFDIPESVVAEWNLRGARTIDLILELEAVRGNDIVAVPVCTAAP